MPTVIPGARTSARSACATSCRAPTKTRSQTSASHVVASARRPLRVSGFEQALAVVADGLPLPAVANTQHPEEPCIAPGAPPQDAIAGHARWAFRSARLERA